MVNNLKCPSCKKGAGREVVEKLLGPEIERIFEWNECGHTWNKVL